MNVELEAMYARMADKIQSRPPEPERVSDMERRLATLSNWICTLAIAEQWGIASPSARDYLMRLLEAGHIQRRKALGKRDIEWKRKEEKPQ